MGVTQIIATNSVGSMNTDMGPGTFVIPDDFLDFSQNRAKTFYEDKVVHIDVTEPYCPTLRDILAKSGDVILGGTYVCTEGPRFETPAEIKMFKMLGGDLVGMTGVPEVSLARERGIVCGDYPRMASTSFWCMMRYFSPSSSTSVPEYFP